nr:lamin tail domain-containing protein [Bacteroidota bacterium]
MASALIFSFHSKAQVIINEYSCSNLTQFVDDHSDYGDWFELYNTGNAAVSLQGMYLSDDSLNNLKWLIPVNVNIGAFGFARFWASGRNVVSGTHFHTNFKFDANKKQ